MSKIRHMVKRLRGVTLLKLLMIPLWSCDPFHTGFDDREEAIMYEARVITPPAQQVERLSVMSWNVKFGGARIDFFFDCHGDRVLMDEDEVRKNLDGLVAKIRRADPDVLFMQEIDVNSKRSAYLDQVQYILDRTALNYGAYASQWKADYIPSDGLGAMDSGNVILSKYPLKDAERIALALQSEQDGLTQYFYLKRNILRARVALPGDKSVWLLNMHADAYSQDGTKKKHIETIEREMNALTERGVLWVGGGDFNTLPPGSQRWVGFEDSVCRDEDFQADDFSEETDWLTSIYDKYSPFVPLADYQADNSKYFTHSTSGEYMWNRQLDYLFTNGQWVSGSGLVHQSVAQGGVDTMPLSDHAPVSAILEVP